MREMRGGGTRSSSLLASHSAHLDVVGCAPDAALCARRSKAKLAQLCTSEGVVFRRSTRCSCELLACSSCWSSSCFLLLCCVVGNVPETED